MFVVNENGTVEIKSEMNEYTRVQNLLFDLKSLINKAHNVLNLYFHMERVTAIIHLQTVRCSTYVCVLGQPLSGCASARQGAVTKCKNQYLRLK